MDIDKLKSKAQEDLALLYLRLNGFFVTGFIAHSPIHGHNLTEIDALALRMPHSAEPEREVGPHGLLDLSSNHADLIICEVKSRGEPLRFNAALTEDPRAAAAVLRWSGLFLEDELPELVTRLQAALAPNPLRSAAPPSATGPRGTRVRGLLFAPERDKRYTNQSWFVTGPELFEYVHRCLSPTQPRSECSVSYDFGLWGDREPIIRYFKDRRGQDAGSMDQLYGVLGIRS